MFIYSHQCIGSIESNTFLSHVMPLLERNNSETKYCILAIKICYIILEYLANTSLSPNSKSSIFYFWDFPDPFWSYVTYILDHNCNTLLESSQWQLSTVKVSIWEHFSSNLSRVLSQSTFLPDVVMACANIKICVILRLTSFNIIFYSVYLIQPVLEIGYDFIARLSIYLFIYFRLFFIYLLIITYSPRKKILFYTKNNEPMILRDKISESKSRRYVKRVTFD